MQTARLQSGNETGKHANEERDDGNEPNDAQIKGVTREREVAKQKTPSERTRPARDDDRRGTAQRSEKHALCQQLLDEAAPRHTKSETHGDLTTAADAPRKQQIRNVGAGDQEHDE